MATSRRSDDDDREPLVSDDKLDAIFGPCVRLVEEDLEAWLRETRVVLERDDDT